MHTRRKRGPSLKQKVRRYHRRRQPRRQRGGEEPMKFIDWLYWIFSLLGNFIFRQKYMYDGDIKPMDGDFVDGDDGKIIIVQNAENMTDTQYIIEKYKYVSSICSTVINALNTELSLKRDYIRFIRITNDTYSTFKTKVNFIIIFQQ